MQRFNCVVCSAGKFIKTNNVTRDYQDAIVACVKCKHLQMHPIPKKGSEKKFYEKDKQASLILKKIEVEDLLKRSEWDTQRRVNKILKKFSTKKTILDIGTGYGFFLSVLEGRGYKPVGIEISSSRLKIARKITKAKIYKQPITGLNKTGKDYDLITMFHVLEHIVNPIGLCTHLKTYLKKNGTLIIEIPNASDNMLKKSISYKKFFWQRAHISYFTKTSAVHVLKKAGYSKIKVTGVQRYSFANAVNWFKNRRPELKQPTYQTAEELSWLEKIYKNKLESKLLSDTLWIEAKA